MNKGLEDYLKGMGVDPDSYEQVQFDDVRRTIWEQMKTYQNALMELQTTYMEMRELNKTHNLAFYKAPDGTMGYYITNKKQIGFKTD